MDCKVLNVQQKTIGLCFIIWVMFSAPQVFAGDLVGKVIETIDSASYTYIQLEINGKHQWVAVPETVVDVGDEVEVFPGMPMGTYSSPTLGRSFKDIILVL